MGTKKQNKTSNIISKMTLTMVRSGDGRISEIRERKRWRRKKPGNIEPTMDYVLY